MKAMFKDLGVREFGRNADGSKVEQKEARALKAELVAGFIASLGDTDVEVMYDTKGKEVLVLANGLVIGFDFVVRNLDTELLNSKE